LKDVTTIRITKSTHKEIFKIMGQIQARTGKIPYLMTYCKRCWV